MSAHARDESAVEKGVPECAVGVSGRETAPATTSRDAAHAKI